MLPYAAPVFLDANGDGKIDLLSKGEQIATYLGNGDGTFQAPVTSPRGSFSPAEVLTGDFNGDGYLDLALTQRQFDYETRIENFTALEVLLGNGEGLFTPARQGVVPGFGFTVGDFNGDGKTDILLLQQDGVVSLFVSNGDGTFTPRQAVTLHGKPGSVAPLLLSADFNQDGNLDFCAGTTVFLGDGNGGFHQAPGLAQDLADIHILRSADWNGDGFPDLVAVTWNEIGPPNIFVILGVGDGSFRNPVRSIAGLDQSGIFSGGNFELGDVNEDGVADIIASTGLSVAIAYGNSDGTLRTPTTIEQAATDGLAAVDLNGDGHSDLLYVSAGKVMLAPGRADGGFLAPEPVRSQQQQVTNYYGPIAAADFDGDGRMDFAAPQRGGGLYVSLQKVRGQWTTASVPLGGPYLELLQAVDLNGDGKPDLLGGATGQDLTVWLNRGDGSFAPPRVSGIKGEDFVVVDWNKDGKPDILATTRNNLNTNYPIVFLAGKGDGTFASPVQLAEGAGVAVGDFDGDGLPDLAYIRLDIDFLSFANVVIRRGRPGGGVGEPEVTPIGWMYSSAYGQLLAADLDGDGFCDLAWSIYNTVAVFAGSRDGLLAPQFFGTVRNSTAIQTADFNGDGKLDLAVGGSGFSGPNDGEIVVLLSGPPEPAAIPATGRRMAWRVLSTTPSCTRCRETGR